MLYRALGSIERGVYIDIGAQHPTIDSVSRAFFERGWFGVHVEPVPEYAAMLREARPGDVVIQAAVSSQAGEISLAVFPDTGLSTVVESVAEGHASQTQFAAARREVVPAVTLSMVGDEVGNRDVHWLKIDVEGHERAVLEGWDASRLRPWICVIEATLPNSAETNHSEWESILLKAGYECAYVDGLNRFYVAEERSARLRQAFDTPPNVFDNCQLGEHASMCRELVTRHHRRLSGLSCQLDLAQQNHRELEAAYKAVKASMSWKLTEPLRVAIDWLNKLAALISYRNGRPAHPPATQGSRDRADRSVSLPTISPATKTWQSRLRQQSQAKT
jgi:FkbM family methyltransferase